MTYAKVINNEVLEYNRILPFSNDTTQFGANATQAEMATHGYYPIIGLEPTYDNTTHRNNGTSYVFDGVQVNKVYNIQPIPLAELQAKAVEHFVTVTDAFIQSKITAYNVANNLAFKDIDSFTKYAVNTTSPHHAIANQFIAYGDKVWTAMRTYLNSGLTSIPTDAQFQVVLDGVVF